MGGADRCGHTWLLTFELCTDLFSMSRESWTNTFRVEYISSSPTLILLKEPRAFFHSCKRSICNLCTFEPLAPPTWTMSSALAEVRPISKVVALVTGAASGLGKATAARLARQVSQVSELAKVTAEWTLFNAQGARVILADLPSSSGAEVAKEIGDNATFVPTDVSVS